MNTHMTMPMMYAWILLRFFASHNQNGTNRIQTSSMMPKNADSSARSMPRMLIFASKSPCATQYNKKKGNVIAIMSTADQLNMYMPAAYRNGMFSHATLND